jgi:hypothetical protein
MGLYDDIIDNLGGDEEKEPIIIGPDGTPPPLPEEEDEDGEPWEQDPDDWKKGKDPRE